LRIIKKKKKIKALPKDAGIEPEERGRHAILNRAENGEGSPLDGGPK
jgi:hypothetical protein